MSPPGEALWLEVEVHRPVHDRQPRLLGGDAAAGAFDGEAHRVSAERLNWERLLKGARVGFGGPLAVQAARDEPVSGEGT